MSKIIATAPTRVDLAGGTLDLWPVYNVLEYKATVNAAIRVPARVELETTDKKDHISIHSQDQNLNLQGTFKDIVNSTTLPLFSELIKQIWRAEYPGLHIKSLAKSPAGAGLGGSSCLGICIAASLFAARKVATGEPAPDERSLVRFVQDCEAKIIHAPTGCQDYWGAVRGKANVIHLRPGGELVETLPDVSHSKLAAYMIICYSGRSRASAINNWEIFKRVFDKDARLVAQLERIGRAAHECGKALLAQDWEAVFAFSQEEWELRKALWPNIETQETKTLDQIAKKEGAIFSRVCGAGGGGVMVMFAEPAKHAAITKGLEAHGGQILPAGIADTGLELTHDA